jgi:hypothetical protein
MMTRWLRLKVSDNGINEYTSHDFLRERLYLQAGLQANGEPMVFGFIPDLDTLKETEWSKNFIDAMRYRMIMGGIRYGMLRDKRKPKYNRIASIKKRLAIFEQDGNAEHLVDIANESMLIFAEECGDKIQQSIDDGNHHTE